jgi:hypothetical protein
LTLERPNQWRIKTTGFTKLFLQTTGGSENAAKNTNIFTEYNGFLIFGHGDIKSTVDRLQHIHFSHYSILPAVTG